MSYRSALFLGLAGVLAFGLAEPSRSPGQEQAPERRQSQSQHQPEAETQPAAQPSLAEIARKVRAEQAANPGKPAKVYTNENLPQGSGGLTVVAPPAEASSAGTATESKHGAAYFSSRMAELQQNLDTHERELAVLQQKLGQNEVQFYSDPNTELQQQFSRSDINKVNDAIEQKKQQIEADKKAIADLEQELRDAGSNPDLLTGVGKADAPTKPDLSGVEKGSQKYWQLRFEAARKAVEQADREQELSEDELNLLKAQQAHEIATSAAPELARQVADKQAQVESDRAAAEKAHQELDALQQEFDQSGAHADWIKPEESSTPR